MSELSTARTKEIIQSEVGNEGSKVGALYASFMDEEGIESKGISPITRSLRAIDDAKNHSALAAVVGTLTQRGVSTLQDIEFGADPQSPNRVIVRLHQGGLGMPERDYYLVEEPSFVTVRTAYRNYLTGLLQLSGLADAAHRAERVLAFETRLASAQWDGRRSRDADQIYNLFTPASMPRSLPGFDWPKYLRSLRLERVAKLSVNEPSAAAGAADAWAATPLPVLKDWLSLHLLDHYAGVLPKRFVDARFEFRGMTLLGQSQMRSRADRGADLVCDELRDLVGQLYVRRYFPPAAKLDAERLVQNLIAAYRVEIQAASWLGADTRAEAMRKLSAVKVLVGYSVHWRDYSGVFDHEHDLVGNVERAEVANYRRKLSILTRPVDRDARTFAAMDLDAMADQVKNTIEFPAATLQAPFFDSDVESAVNYAAIGSVIGHEIGHLFDDQGRKFDATGRKRLWWTKRETDHFDTEAGKLVEQYGAYEPLPGLHLDGRLTVGENLADLAGVSTAHLAYVLSLDGKSAPLIDGLTGDQRFFLGYAQSLRFKFKSDALRVQISYDVHSPPEQRVDTVRNIDIWYTAFGVLPADAMYLPPTGRVHVW